MRWWWDDDDDKVEEEVDVEIILQSPWPKLYEGLRLTLLVAWKAERAEQEYPRAEEPNHFEDHQSFDLNKKI